MIKLYDTAICIIDHVNVYPDPHMALAVHTCKFGEWNLDIYSVVVRTV